MHILSWLPVLVKINQKAIKTALSLSSDNDLDLDQCSCNNFEPRQEFSDSS